MRGRGAIVCNHHLTFALKQVKCEQYWPTEGAQMKSGTFSLRIVSQRVSANYIQREINITHTEVRFTLHNYIQRDTNVTHTEVRLTLLQNITDNVTLASSLLLGKSNKTFLITSHLRGLATKQIRIQQFYPCILSFIS